MGQDLKANHLTDSECICDNLGENCVLCFGVRIKLLKYTVKLVEKYVITSTLLVLVCNQINSNTCEIRS